MMLIIENLINPLQKFLMALFLFALLVGCDDKDGYIVENGQTYFKHNNYWTGGHRTTINLDPGEKLIISSSDKHYAMDNFNVYFRGTKMLDASPKEIKIYRRDLVASNNPSYAISGDKVYLDGVVIPEAQSASFLLLRYEGSVSRDYSRDANNVFFLEEVLDNAEANSFEVVDLYWGKDSKQYYYKNIGLIPKDPSSFKIIRFSYNTSFARDKDNIYHLGKVLANFHPSTTQILGLGSVIKDKNAGCFEFHENNGDGSWVPVKIEDYDRKCID